MFGKATHHKMMQYVPKAKLSMPSLASAPWHAPRSSTWTRTSSSMSGRGMLRSSPLRARSAARASDRAPPCDRRASASDLYRAWDAPESARPPAGNADPPHASGGLTDRAGGAPSAQRDNRRLAQRERGRRIHKQRAAAASDYLRVSTPMRVRSRLRLRAYMRPIPRCMCHSVAFDAILRRLFAELHVDQCGPVEAWRRHKQGLSATPLVRAPSLLIKLPLLLRSHARLH